MPSINTPTSAHVGPAANSGWQWLPYSTEPDLRVLKHAIHIIDAKIKSSKTCSAAFKALPGGRTFAEVWNDASVWISYDPGTANLRYGATLGSEVTISAFTLRVGYWSVAATLIHELAHVNGASGANHDAEATLKKCLLSGLENPRIIGSLFHPSGSVLIG